MGTDGFQEHRLKILSDIQRLSDSLLKLQDITSTIAIEIVKINTTARTKTIAWGGFGGAVVVIITIAIAVVSLWGTFMGKG